MLQLPQIFCLIVPCYNETRRLSLDVFRALPEGSRCMSVDDRSKNCTGELINRAASANTGLP
jgi:hypothetical protein